MENKKERSNVWWLSATSFFTDISSEMIFPILPIFLKDVLGASFGLIGLIEGLAEGLGSILKYFSGYISDKIHKRKGLTLLGYGLSAVSKLFFALAQSSMTVLFFRLVLNLTLSSSSGNLSTNKTECFLFDFLAIKYPKCFPCEQLTIIIQPLTQNSIINFFKVPLNSAAIANAPFSAFLFSFENAITRMSLLLKSKYFSNS